MRVPIILLFLFSFYFSNGQLETKNWFLYDNHIAVTPSGVTTGLPLPGPGVFSTPYGSTSISDAGGNLLFASNGSTIIDRNLAVMPALINVNFFASTGKKLIQKIPGSNQYYLFYCTANPPGTVNVRWTLKYAIVDMALNSGNGDVIVYNQVIDTSLSPSFTLVAGANPSEAWLVTHKHATDSFYTYPITAAGLGNTAVKSRAGTNATLSDYIFREMKTSFDGKMIAANAYRDYSGIFATTYGLIEVFNFNAINGTLTPRVRTRRTFGYFYTYFSFEFSTDNRVLYSCQVQRITGIQPCGFGFGAVGQYNLCYSDSILFERYSMRVASDFQFCGPNITWGTIQMGANKKIHMPYSGTTVSNINTPNRIGTSCNYVFNAYQLPTTNSTYSAAPTFHHQMMEKAVKNNIVYEGGCHPNPITFRITNDTISSISWNFGDPASPNNTSTLLSPSHVFSSPGIYTVTAQLYNSQNALIETVTELVEIKDPGRRLLYDYPDTSFCSGGVLNIHLQVVNGIFHWYQLFPGGGGLMNSTISDSIRITTSGTYYVEMRQNDCNGCIMLDSIHVSVLPKPSFSLGPDRNLCQGDSILLSVNDPDASFLWSTGATTSSIWVNQGGLYWVQAEYNNNGCPTRDSVIITQVPGVNFSLPPDTTLCNNQTLLLNPGVPNANYLWQNGSTQPTFLVTMPGTYWVKITSANSCTKSDTIIVSYINAQQVNLGADTTLCAGSSLLLQANIPNAQYLWSTGASTNQITVFQSGTYWVRVNNGSCTVSDTINVTFAAPPLLFLGNDTTLCKNDQLLLNPGITNASYLWQDGSTQPVFNVTQAGTYWLRVIKNSCVVRDTININYYSVPAIDLGPDTRFCTGDSIMLNAGPGFNQYLWNNGKNTQQIIVNAPGSYSVTATTADGCKSRDTVIINSLYPLPVVDLGFNGPLCIGNNQVLDAGAGFSQYLWSTGNTSQTITVNNPGSYAVMVTDQNGCRGSDTAWVTSLLPSPVGFLPPDTSVCSYGSISLFPSASYNQYLWSTGSNNISISVTQPGSYWLQVRDNNNCTGSDTINVSLKDCMLGVYIPTAFTPGNDGRNDILKPMVFGNMLQYHFTVYDRAGQVMFSSSTPGQGWDGRNNGQSLNTAVFVWVCRYQLSGEEVKLQKGTVLLIR
ncbi:MAG TPA: T9SS type B sorting domain-containing protein [Chitinophagaceae bacterium]|nr:T9SS type B sorting domain-containing protein [Chitinophagaceae bacterium]